MIFVAKESDTTATDLQIAGQRSTNAPAFANVDFDISSRPLTTAGVAWMPPFAGSAGSESSSPAWMPPSARAAAG